MNALARALRDDFDIEAIVALHRLERAAATAKADPADWALCRRAYEAALALLAVVDAWRGLVPAGPPLWLTPGQGELWDAGLTYARFGRLVRSAGWWPVTPRQLTEATRAAFVIGALSDTSTG